MPKDFANLANKGALLKKPYKSSKTLLLCAVLIAILALYLERKHNSIYHTSTPLNSPSNLSSNASSNLNKKQKAGKTPKSAVTKEQPSGQNQENHSKEFSFYHLLSNMHVEISHDETKLNPSAPSLPKDNEKVYIVQLPTFTAEKKAVRLQTELAELGFEVKYKKKQHAGGSTWYYTYLGPFNELGLAQQQVNELNDAKFYTAVLREDNI